MTDRRRVLLEHGGTVVTFEGRAASSLLPRLLPLLDGTRTVDQVEEALGRPVAPAVVRALALLAENQLLVEGSDEPRTTDDVTAAASFAAAVTRRATPAEARARLVAARIAVLGSDVEATTVRRLLGDAGLGRVAAADFETDTADALVVAVPGRRETDLLAGLNRRLVEDGRPWLQVLPYDGRHLVVGPLFLPGSSACGECYRLRRAACSGFEEDFGLIEREPTRAPLPRPLATIGASLATLLLIRWITASDPSLPGRFYALETGTILRLSHHHVLRVPRCSVCAPAVGAVPLPWFKEGT